MHTTKLFAFNPIVIALLVIGIAALQVQADASESAQDVEATKHGFEAAQYEVVDTYEYSDFNIVQIDLSVLSHYSYLLLSDGECLVVDPGRDIEVYLREAKERTATIKGVYLTHSHADFVTGHMELADRLHVPVYISAKSGVSYEHQPIQESETLEIGLAIVQFLETPGHTPDGTCALVSSMSEPEKPSAMFTGDTLFIGSVGRPDLLGEGMAASTLASMMFDTWYDKLAKLPDEVEIFPAHGAGSLCGAHLSDEPTSTLGAQRVANPYFRYRDRGEFVATVLEGLPQAPQYFKHNAAMNHAGPELVDWDAKELPWIEPLETLVDSQQYYVVDLREAATFAASHIPNSVNIGIRGRFETWVGMMVPWEAQVVVCGATEGQLREAVQRLHRVGYQAQCLLLETWKSTNLALASNEMIDSQELYAQMQTTESPVIVDVRLPAEWMALRVGATVNLPLNELSQRSSTLDRQQPLVTVCNSAYRSSMAVGVLQRQGFQNVSNLAGGGKAWINAGLPVIEAKRAGAVSTSPKRDIRLAERISATELKRLLMDMPGTFELIDVRPPAHFADYHLPDAVNVDLAEVLDNPAYLTGAGPLILVDRDGSLAMMVGGILSRQTERTIKVLYGGMQAYWSESDYGSFAQPLPNEPAARQPSPAAPQQTPSTSPVTKPKKRSAGC